MTRYGPPDDGGYYAEDPYPAPGGPPEPEAPKWYRTPAAMFAAGVLAALLLVFIVWAVFRTGSEDVPGSTEAPLTPITPTAPATTATTAERVTETVTVTETSTVPPTTTTVTTTTTPEPTVSTTTVTVTEPPPEGE